MKFRTQFHKYNFQVPIREESLFIKKKGTRENFFLTTLIFMKQKNFESNKRKTVEDVPIGPYKQTHTCSVLRPLSRVPFRWL